jgi:hypothetical protein
MQLDLEENSEYIKLYVWSNTSLAGKNTSIGVKVYEILLTQM